MFSVSLSLPPVWWRNPHSLPGLNCVEQEAGAGFVCLQTTLHLLLRFLFFKTFILVLVKRKYAPRPG